MCMAWLGNSVHRSISENEVIVIPSFGKEHALFHPHLNKTWSTFNVVNLGHVHCKTPRFRAEIKKLLLEGLFHKK